MLSLTPRQIVKSRVITVLAKVCINKAIVFPVVMYGYDNWIIKKAERWRIDPFFLKVTQTCQTLCDPIDYSPWNSPGQNTRVGSLSFLQGISPTQGSNPGLPHCRQILCQLSHQGSPELLLLNCGVGEDSWQSLRQQGDQTSQSQRKSILNIHWKDWCWSWSSNTLATWSEDLTH